jgi:transglutaminase-like putative cysteine protease
LFARFGANRITAAGINMNTLFHKLNNAPAANVWLFAGLVMVILPHFAYQKFAIMVCCSMLLLWRFLYDIKTVNLPPRWLRVILAFSAFAGVGALHHTIFGRDAGVSLLLIMLCLKLLEMQKKRDFIVAVSLGFFVVITEFLYSQSMLIAVYMFATTIVLTTALTVSHRLKPTLCDSTNIRLAGTMLLLAIPMAILLFMLFPRLPSPMWGLPEDAFAGKSGLSDHMSPGQISRLSDNDAVAFRVQFSSPLPTPSQLYWRGPVFSHFDGKTWSGNQATVLGETAANTIPATIKYRNSGKASIELRQQDIVGFGNMVGYSITLEPHNQHYLFALEMPALLPPQSTYSEAFELISNQPVKKLRHYELRSFLDYGLEPNRLANRHVYLQLPSNVGIKAQQMILQLITSIADQKDRDEKIVAAMLNYFRQQPFVYTKQPPLLPEDPIDQFLFESRQGFCEHYASAFTFLMRAAGIPARVVTGYQGGEFNSLGDYLIVRQSDAHAWAEVWITGKGWRRVDPTAAIPPERVQYDEHLQRFRSTVATTTVDLSWVSSAWRKMKLSWDNVNHFWNMWIIGYNNKKQNSFMSWLGMEGFGWQGLAVTLFSGLFALVLLVAFQLLYRSHASSDPVQKTYQRYCRKLERIGLRKSHSEGASHFAQRAIGLHPELSGPIKDITRLYNSIRYSPYDASDHRREAELRAAVNRFHPQRLLANQSGKNNSNNSFK